MNSETADPKTNPNPNAPGYRSPLNALVVGIALNVGVFTLMGLPSCSHHAQAGCNSMRVETARRAPVRPANFRGAGLMACVQPGTAHQQTQARKPMPRAE